ncbi:MAG: PEP-CTERM sorting domain-containing protein [Bryobacteraceae bacterium]
MSGTASIYDNSGNGYGCGFIGLLNSPPCSGTFMPIVFDSPETLSVSLSLYEEWAMQTVSGGNYGASLSERCCSFEFFNDQEQPLTGVSFSFGPAPGELPTPEPGTFLLLAGVGIAGLVRRLLR